MSSAPVAVPPFTDQGGGAGSESESDAELPTANRQRFHSPCPMIQSNSKMSPPGASAVSPCCSRTRYARKTAVKKNTRRNPTDHPSMAPRSLGCVRGHGPWTNIDAAVCPHPCAFHQSWPC